MVVASVEVEHRLIGVETFDLPISGWDVPSNLGCTCWRTNHGCIVAEVVYYFHKCLQHMSEVVHYLTSLDLSSHFPSGYWMHMFCMIVASGEANSLIILSYILTS